MMDSRCYALMIMAVSFGPRGTERAVLLGVRTLTSPTYFSALVFSLPDEAGGNSFV
jgi:hypothetical protein